MCLHSGHSVMILTMLRGLTGKKRSAQLAQVADVNYLSPLATMSHGEKGGGPDGDSAHASSGMGSEVLSHNRS